MPFIFKTKGGKKMKRLSIFFLTLTLSFGIIVFFSGCNSTSLSNEKGPSRIIFSDASNKASINFDLTINKINIESGTTEEVFCTSNVKLNRGSSKNVNVVGRLDAYSYYQVNITPENNARVVYRAGSASYDFFYKNVFMAPAGKNIKIKLEDFCNNTYYFKLEEI